MKFWFLPLTLVVNECSYQELYRDLAKPKSGAALLFSGMFLPIVASGRFNLKLK